MIVKNECEKPDAKLPDVCWKLVTPEYAKELIKQNVNNRKVRQWRVAQLADSLRRGEWEVNGDTIRIYEDNTLADAQHRLLAIVEAGTPVWCLFVCGIKKRAGLTIDRGSKRTNADDFKIAGYSSTTALAASIAWKWRIDKGYQSRSESPTSCEAKKVLEENPGIEESVSLVSCLKNLAPVSVLGAWHYEGAMRNKPLTDRMVEGMRTGAGLQEGSPTLVIQRKLMAIKSQKNRIEHAEILALLIKAWNFENEGKKVMRIHWSSRGERVEEFPSFPKLKNK